MASGTWTSVATSGAWSLATNWSGSTIADGSGNTASFTSNITATTTIDTTIGGGWSGNIGDITFSDNGASGSTWTLGTQSTITLGSLSTITTTTGATISGILAGAAGGLTKTGAQTLTLSAANTFSGSFTINAGTVSVTNASGLGPNMARVVTVTSGAVLSLGASITGSNLTPDISGTGIAGVNDGAVVLATAVTANLGAITLGASASIRAAATATLSSSILTASGRNLTLQGAPTFTGTFSGAITGAGALIVGGTAGAGLTSQTGTVTLSSLTNGYTGNTTVSTGTMTVSGLLGSGSYVGNISIASGATFSYTSSSNQTLSGSISGPGTLTKTTGTASVLTLSGTNSFSTLNISAGTVSVASIVNNIGSGVTTINIGATTVAGTLLYTGSGETTSKVINLAGTTGGATITQNGSGALVFSSALTATGNGQKTLTLQGTNTGANELQGAIVDSTSPTLLTKAGVGYWKATGANTYTGNVLVSGGQLDVTALTTLGSLAANKTAAVSGSTTRNASALLNVASATYPSTLSWSLNSGGVDQTNNPLGAIRARADSTIAGTVTLAGTSTVYADTGDLTFNGAISGTSTFFQTRAALGRTVTISGGFGNAATAFGAIGPGTTVWNGSSSNTTTIAPNITGGTLKMVTTTSTATLPLQFAFLQVNLGGTASQTNQISSRYQYTCGTLELSNSGAAGAVSYSGLTNTSALNLSRGSGKLKLSRDSAQDFSVTLGGITASSGVVVVEYGGSAGTGVIGTNSSIIVSGFSASTAVTRTYITNGSALVPVFANASKVLIPAAYTGSQNGVAVSQPGGTTLTLLSTNFGFYNLTGDISAQASAITRGIRFDTGTTTPITLAAGALLRVEDIMDMGTGSARTIVASASGAKLTRNPFGGGTLSVYTNNVTGTGATISADMDARYNAAFTKAGVGLLTLTGKVDNLSAFNLSDGSVSFPVGSSFNNPFAPLTVANDFTNATNATFAQAAPVTVGGLSGGGANTAVTLGSGAGDLVVSLPSTVYTFGGDIVLGGSQKLKVQSLSNIPENNGQSFQGAFPFSAIEMTRGFISLDPQYGWNFTGASAPTVTVTGGSYIAIQALNPLSADYTVALGALTVSAGNLRVSLANSTTSGNAYNTRVTIASVTAPTGDSTLYTMNQVTNPQQTFTVTAITSAGVIPFAGRTDGVNVWQGGNIAYYRLAGSALASASLNLTGGTTTVDTIDLAAYGTGAGYDGNFPASKTTGASITASANENINVTTTAITAQSSVTMKSLRTAVNVTMVAANRLATDLILPQATTTIAVGEVSTQTGNLYINTASGALTISSNVVDNGGTLTKLVYYGTAATNLNLTLSGTNTYSGGTVLNGGASTLILGSVGALGSGAVIANGGAGLSRTTAGSYTISNFLKLNDGGLTLNASAGVTLVVAGAISNGPDGAGDLYLSGAGSFDLAGGNSATRALRLVGSSGTTSVVTLSSAQGWGGYDFNTSTTNYATLQYTSGFTSDISALITKRPGNYYRIDTNGNDVTWASSFGNGSTYVKVGSGTHTLGAENFLSTVTVTTGTVKAGNVAALGYGTVTLSAGTTLQTLTTGGQNGKLTVASLTNSAGGSIRIGG